MDVFHGGTEIIGRVNFDKCRKRTDFGKGMYFSDKAGTAQRWAMKRVEAKGYGVATILRYELNWQGLISLPGKQFGMVPTIDWLNFVKQNRQRKNTSMIQGEPRHNYHWVSGPIADDKMNDIVEEYFNNKCSAEEAIRRARVLPQTFQVSLHTRDALLFLDETAVYYRQRKNEQWRPTNKWLLRK
jgi:hypothetical protein